jgi:hypothetical protein
MNNLTERLTKNIFFGCIMFILLTIFYRDTLKLQQITTISILSVLLNSIREYLDITN